MSGLEVKNLSKLFGVSQQTFRKWIDSTSTPVEKGEWRDYSIENIKKALMKNEKMVLGFNMTSPILVPEEFQVIYCDQNDEIPSYDFSKKISLHSQSITYKKQEISGPWWDYFVDIEIGMPYLEKETDTSNLTWPYCMDSNLVKKLRSQISEDQVMIGYPKKGNTKLDINYSSGDFIKNKIDINLRKLENQSNFINPANYPPEYIEKHKFSLDNHYYLLDSWHFPRLITLGSLKRIIPIFYARVYVDNDDLLFRSYLYIPTSGYLS